MEHHGVFLNEREKAEFVTLCEASFEADLERVCVSLLASGAKIIALSGPTCSGKTTAAAKITEALRKEGHSVHLISIDNFFRDRDNINREAEMKKEDLDYDSVSAIDLGLLSKRVSDILAGRECEIPVYDFVAGRATESYKIAPDESSVFIFEGIQAIYPEVTALFGDSYKSVYICVENDIRIDRAFFGKREIRLMRRLVRDFNFRGAEPNFTFFLWRSVTANEDKNILPYADTADLRIDSIIPYEVFLMKELLPPILERVPEDDIFYPKAVDILKKLELLDGFSPNLVPATSLLREFMG